MQEKKEILNKSGPGQPVQEYQPTQQYQTIGTIYKVIQLYSLNKYFKNLFFICLICCVRIFFGDKTIQSYLAFEFISKYQMLLFADS